MLEPAREQDLDARLRWLTERIALLRPYQVDAALMASTFVPDPARRRDVKAITGEIPSAFDRPDGCAFAARCPRASGRCRSERPVLAETSGHAVACHFPLD